VWQGTIPAEQLHHYERTVRVVTVRNEEGGRVSVRYVSENPGLPDSQTAAPRLEDLYLWLFRGEEVKRSDWQRSKFHHCGSGSGILLAALDGLTY